MYEEGGKLYFCTNNTKEVFRQLKANLFVQFSSSNARYEWIRLSGEVRFTGDFAAKTRVFEASELVRSVYNTGQPHIRSLLPGTRKRGSCRLLG